MHYPNTTCICSSNLATKDYINPGKYDLIKNTPAVKKGRPRTKQALLKKM